MAIRQDVLIFWNPGNFMAEMQSSHALKQFVRKGGMSFSRISHTRCLSGSVMCCEIKKNCRINSQCKNVIMAAHGNSVCGPCPSSRAVVHIVSAILPVCADIQCAHY